jgi:hypothetical protein
MGCGRSFSTLPDLRDWNIVGWSIGIGTPAIISGSFLSHVVGARPLLLLTGILVLGFGLVVLGAVPFSHLGARLAINTRAAKLERWS